jgi:hypothetical protein
VLDLFKKNKKGQVAFYFIFLFIASIVILIGAVASPFGARLATEFYSAGEDLLIDTQTGVIPNIQDEGVRNALNDTFTSAVSSAETNITIATGLYQYSWVFVLVLVGIVIYLYARSTVAFQSVV